MKPTIAALLGEEYDLRLRKTAILHGEGGDPREIAREALAAAKEIPNAAP